MIVLLFDHPEIGMLCRADYCTLWSVITIFHGSKWTLRPLEACAIRILPA